MKVIQQLKKIKYSIVLSQEEAEDLLEYLDADSSPYRQNDLCHLLHTAGVRTPMERANNVEVRLNADSIRLSGENDG